MIEKIIHAAFLLFVVWAPANSFHVGRTPKEIGESSSRLMLRNIDLPEALIFYGRHILVEGDDGDNLSTPRCGLVGLLDECKDINTPAILIATDYCEQEEEMPLALPIGLESLHVFQESGSSSSVDQQQKRKPPNPRSLYEAMNSIIIQPKGFGGSLGFEGTVKSADPERTPLPQFVVVFTDSIEVCRAAQYLGMRVVCLEDNDLADAVVEGFDSIYLDDVATPGSFWLNPSHPRDEYGDRVDIHEIMQRYETKVDIENWDDETNDKATKNAEVALAPMQDDEIDRILADLDPL